QAIRKRFAKCGEFRHHRNKRIRGKNKLTDHEFSRKSKRYAYLSDEQPQSACRRRGIAGGLPDGTDWWAARSADGRFMRVSRTTQRHRKGFRNGINRGASRGTDGRSNGTWWGHYGWLCDSNHWRMNDG